LAIGYTNASCPDEEELKELGEGMSQAAYRVRPSTLLTV